MHQIRFACLILVCLIPGACALPSVFAQSEVEQVRTILGEEILPSQVALFQVREYILRHTAEPPVPTTAAEWTAQSARTRQRLLGEVVFHGWPRLWVEAPPRFEEMGVIETGQGYRMRKLRYEVVPGLYSAAILYEPDRLSGKVPAILNVNGHVGAPGKAVEYKQKRCINFARRGILALNLEWLAFGELSQPENSHWFGSHLNLVGAQEVGLFYLAMRKGLDYLDQHPNADRGKLGVTGLSGGGWQTIILSALDDRVAVSVPVAGFASTRTRVEAREFGDLGDLEQNATDVLEGLDYPHLVAMRAPRPTLLAYNAEDNCCFRAPMAKPYIYDAIRPFFRLYGKEAALAWHENQDPGNHNYQLDNRVQAYRFFSEHFGLPPVEGEIPVDSEIKSYDELVVGLPKDNLTILGLARRLAEAIVRPPIPSGPDARTAWADSERQKLRTVVRYKAAEVRRAWITASTKNKEVESFSRLFEMNNGLYIAGTFLKSVRTPASAPATIVLHDKGGRESAPVVSDRVNRGEQVLAADLLFVGDAWVKSEPFAHAQILEAQGDRTIGLQAAQLVAITRWIQSCSGAGKIRLEATGMRSQVAALMASALEPDLYSGVFVHEGIPSLGYLLEKPVQYSEAPELFCLDLYKEFDLDRLAAIGVSGRVGR